MLNSARLPLVALLLAVLVLPGCASSRDDYQTASSDIIDPLEPLNRSIDGINTAADILFIGPASTIYREGMPQPVQKVVRNFFRNLELPVIAVNKLLQGNLDGFGTAVGRFLVNTTVGVVGLGDVATGWGLPYEQTDFGVTLASWGAPHGFYLVLPLIGPSSLRDGTGKAVDWYADPIRLAADQHDAEGALLAISSLRLLDARGGVDAAIRDTRKNSLDPYATFRSLYAQHRAATIDAQLGRDKQAVPTN